MVYTSPARGCKSQENLAAHTQAEKLFNAHIHETIIGFSHTLKTNAL
jgi:hypothetical protein